MSRLSVKRKKIKKKGRIIKHKYMKFDTYDPATKRINIQEELKYIKEHPFRL